MKLEAMVVLFEDVGKVLGQHDTCKKERGQAWNETMDE